MLGWSSAEVRLNPYVVCFRLAMLGTLLIDANLWHVAGDARPD
jgi:hypothetical protein